MRAHWLGALIVVLASTAQAGPQVPASAAARVIVGEAADQGLKGMICVGEVLRRRGSIKGFYGYYARHVERESPATWKMATQAWALSRYTHYTRGADHFENVRKFGRPWWAKDCIKTYTYKAHVFYKEIRPAAL